MSSGTGNPRRSKSLLRTRFGWLVEKPDSGPHATTASGRSEGSDPKTGPGLEESHSSVGPTADPDRNARDAFEEVTKAARSRFGFRQSAKGGDDLTCRSEPGREHEIDKGRYSDPATARPHWRRTIYPRTVPRFSSTQTPTDNQSKEESESKHTDYRRTESDHEIGGTVSISESAASAIDDCTGSIDTVSRGVSVSAEGSNLYAEPSVKECNPSEPVYNSGQGTHCTSTYTQGIPNRESTDCKAEDAEDSLTNSSDAVRIPNDAGSNSETGDTSDNTLEGDTAEDSDGSSGSRNSVGNKANSNSNAGTDTDSDSSSRGMTRHAYTHQMTPEEFLAVQQCSCQQLAGEQEDLDFFSSLLDLGHPALDRNISPPALALPTIAEVTEPSYSESDADYTLGDSDDPDKHTLSLDRPPLTTVATTRESPHQPLAVYGNTHESEADTHTYSDKSSNPYNDNRVGLDVLQPRQLHPAEYQPADGGAKPIFNNPSCSSGKDANVLKLMETPASTQDMDAVRSAGTDGEAGFIGNSNIAAMDQGDGVYLARPYVISRGKIWLQKSFPANQRLAEYHHRYDEETTSFIGGLTQERTAHPEVGIAVEKNGPTWRA